MAYFAGLPLGLIREHVRERERARAREGQRGRERREKEIERQRDRGCERQRESLPYFAGLPPGLIREQVREREPLLAFGFSGRVLNINYKGVVSSIIVVKGSYPQ